MEVFIKVINGLVMTPEEDKRCLCVWLLYYDNYVSNFCRFANEGAKISIRVPLHEIIFLLSVFSSSEVLAKITSIQSELVTAACWCRGIQERKLCSQLALCRNRLRYHRHHKQINHSVVRPLRR